MTPGAPSQTASKGSPSLLRVSPGRRRALSRRPPSIRPSTPAGPCAHRGRCPRRREHRFAPPARTQPFGDAIDVEIGDRVLGKIALGEAFILRPQLLGDLA